MNDDRLIVPALDDEPWPTLGPEVCDFIEAYLPHGPGDLIGEPKTLSDEERLFIYRAYEIYPRGHRMEGRRRFKQVGYSRRKGVAKTELAAMIAITECDPRGPVRFDGWDADGNPVGRPVTDPYIPMLAFTEEQVEELAFRAVYEILAHSELVDDYDLTLERIEPKDHPGRIVPLAGSPSARDGARTTHQNFDEPHRMTSPRLREAVATMLRNVPKRKAADAWSLYSSTMYGPGEGSIFEDLHTYALAIATGKVQDPRLYFDHRQASEKWDLAKPKELRAAILEASGDAAEWADVDGIIALFRDPSTDENEFRRYWLNQRRKLTVRWIDLDVWAALHETRELVDGEKICLGFDGSYRHDSTALVAVTVEEHPHVHVLKTWEKPLRAPATWRVPRLDVEAAIEDAMERYQVLELVCDPPGWHREIEDWAAKYGEVVVEFDTNQATKFGPACDSFEQAVSDKAISHDGAEVLARHLGNCVAVKRGRFTVVDKSEPNSPDKIDTAVATILGYSGVRRQLLNPLADPWAMFA